ncbi:hypothetical protein Lal_00019672 [Lupinus albus]|uniref:Putative hemerythrin n=1 Tax=Lupinus albus TaxID=3870 RepID=A0A6A4R7H6_LUPAL|nr:putative hemerythrin [Lupinus albus]KAF1899544.1 hypothetical protein Lal_00019672 [Lupinus albus]
MGNCLRTPERLTAEIVPQDGAAMYPAVRLHGSPETVMTAYIRFMLLHETAPCDSAPAPGRSLVPEITTAPAPRGGGSRSLVQFSHARFASENGGRGKEGITSEAVIGYSPPPARGGGSGFKTPVPGSEDALLQFIDARFPNLPAAVALTSEEKTTSLVAGVTVLQHKSMTWHVERMVRWTEDLMTRGGKKGVDPKMGNWKMEMTKFKKSYSQLWEVMMEHAQMEEMVLFPIFDRADRGLTKAAKEEHARDLPLMNGIKEIIKSVEVLDSGSPNYRETLQNLSRRFKSLQEQCKQHFMTEEVDLLSLMEAVELSEDQDNSALEQCFDVMQGTHSLLLKFFLEGLQSNDAMKYLDLISKCRDRERMESMLRMIVE